MKCPRCQTPQTSEEARYCLNCGAPLEIQRRVEVNVQASQNQGNLIGVQAGTLNGDVYGQNIVYVLSDSGRAAGSLAFFQRGTPPYKALASYTARDRPIYKGRDEESSQVIGRIGEQPVLVVYGASGAGKTSLMAAGVIPRLVEVGALAVHVRDYAKPVAETIRDALAASADAIKIKLPQAGDLPGLLRGVRDELKGTLVLILDQAEKLVLAGGSKQEGGALAAELADSLDQLGPEYLRVIFAIDEQQAFHLETWRDRLPDVQRGGIHLLQLTTEQARAAIVEPLGKLNDPVHYDVGFDADLVKEVLLPDLDELTPKTPGMVFPPHLQIVCDRLYREARDQSLREIGRGLYLDRLQSADGILAAYFRERFTLLPEQQRPAARRVLVWLSRPATPEWNPAEQFAGADLPLEQSGQLLDALESGGLLVSRPVNSHREFALTSPALAAQVRLYLGDLDASGYDPDAELARIWSAWLAAGDLPGEAQIRRLESSRGRCEHTAVQALLLLRAAAASNLPTGPWLEWLRSSPDAPGLIRRLEGIEGGTGPLPAGSISHVDKAERILNLREIKDPGDTGTGKPIGKLALAAVTSPDTGVRQTAGLALMVLEEGIGLKRLEDALWHAQGAPAGARGARWTELRGAMADADPALEKLNDRLGPLERARIRLWRNGRRMARDQQRITWLSLGGGIGAGLGLGLLRALTAALTQLTIGLHAFMNFGFGFLLGAALVFGMLLGEYLRLQRQATAGWPARRAALLSTLLGGAAFGIGSFIVSLATGSFSLAGKGLVTAAGFAAGLFLALAFYPFPYHSEAAQGGLRGWPLRVLGAGVLFALVHLAFVAQRIEDISAVIIWPGSLYRAELLRLNPLPLWNSLQNIPGWYNGVSTLDAFLAGAVLCGGILLSFRLVGNMIRRWQGLVKSWGEE